MLENVRAHSETVGKIAHKLALLGEKKGISINPSAVLASGLLHDLAKTWCIRNYGSHAMLGASWVVRETGDYNIAQGVLLHVHWPWPLPDGENIYVLPILVLYADKRARHAACVTLEERFEDLLVRYGHTSSSREGIKKSMRQAEEIEKRLSQVLGMDIGGIDFCSSLSDKSRTS